MLPVVAGEVETAKQIWIYTLIMVPVTLLLVYPLHVMGAVYTVIALLLAGIFLAKAWALLENPGDYATARSLFKYSIFYLMLLCAGMAVDSLPITHQVTEAIAQNLNGLVNSSFLSQVVLR